MQRLGRRHAARGRHRLSCLACCGMSCCAPQQVQADDIKVYLAATLGQAPKPDWGLKNGWGQYLAGERLCVWFLSWLLPCNTQGRANPADTRRCLWQKHTCLLSGLSVHVLAAGAWPSA